MCYVDTAGMLLGLGKSELEPGDSSFRAIENCLLHTSVVTSQHFFVFLKTTAHLYYVDDFLCLTDQF